MMKSFQLIAVISVLATFSPVASFALLGSLNGASSLCFWKSHPTTATTELSAEGGRINTKIDLESPKVATMDAIEVGKKKVYCRCWQSGTFPLCDGSHMKHNEATGDNVGPLIVSVQKES